MKKTALLAVLISMCCIQLHAREKVTAEIRVDAGIFPRNNTVVSADISHLVSAPATPVALFETVNGKQREVPSQTLAEDGKVKLFWVMDGVTKNGNERVYTLQVDKKPKKNNVMCVEDRNGALILKKGKEQIIQYNYKTVYPPAGIDSSYRRSGFLHPVWSPSGNVLTTIQPKDHYHHYGIWNPWTKLEYDGAIYDLWNLRDKKGTVRHDENIEKTEGVVFAGFKAKLNHIVFNKAGETTIMNEIWNVKAWNFPESKSMLWEFESILNPCTSLPVLLKAYRYAGFGYRAVEEWTRKNCEMMTSEGKTRQQIDGSNGRWIYITGQCKNGRSGLLFMAYPKNRNYPEPLRIWDENANGGRGDAFINFAPTKNEDWNLESGKEYRLRYRVLSYDGEMTPDRAESLWADFAYPPYVSIK